MSRDEFLTFSTGSNARTAQLPRDLQLLITDTLESPGTFLLTYFIAKALRHKVKRNIVFVGVSNDLEGLESILKKMGIQIGQEIDKNYFTFIDGSATVGTDDDSALTSLFDGIEGALRRGNAEEGPLLLIDDVSSLLWAGHDPSSIVRALSRLRNTIGDVGASLVVLLHGDDLTAETTSSDAYLFRQVLQRSDLWLQTTSLASQSRGELAIHRGPAAVEDYGIVARSGATALQYKLEEAGAVFSVKGLGHGYL